jgi:uncharacterized membrane protein YbhN (UPF0104 family)
VALALAGIAVLVLLVRRWTAHGFDASLFVRLAGAADVRWLLAAWAMALVAYGLRAVRWRLMIARMHPDHPLGPVMSATFLGYTGTLLIGRPAEFLRPILIARFEGLTVASQLAVWLIERIYDTLLLFALFGYALLVSFGNAPAGSGPLAVFVWKIGGWTAAIVCSLCLFVLIGLHFYPGHLEDAVARMERNWPGRVGSKLTRFARRALVGIHSVRGAGAVAGLLLLSVSEWVLVAGVYLAVFRAFPATAHLGFTDACVFSGMAGIGTVIQIPGIGGGFQIASVAALTEFFGVRVEQAGLIALAAWITGFVGVLPFGVLALFERGLSWRRLMLLSHENVEGS